MSKRIVQRVSHQKKEEMPPVLLNEEKKSEKIASKKNTPKKGLPPRKGNPTIENLELNGELEVSSSVNIETKKSIKIGTITNPNDDDENKTVRYNLEGGIINIGFMKENGNTTKENVTFDFIIGPGGDTQHGISKDKPITFRTGINDVKSRWYTKLRSTDGSYDPDKTNEDQGYYVLVSGQYFDGKTPGNDATSKKDDDSFGFWKSIDLTEANPGVDYDTNIEQYGTDETHTVEYTTEPLDHSNAQFYFDSIDGIYIRTDKCPIVKEDNTRELKSVDIYMVPGKPKEDGEDFSLDNNTNSIIAKYYDDNNNLVPYTGCIKYPFRTDDSSTVKIENGTREKVLEKYQEIDESLNIASDDLYTNDLRFESLPSKTEGGITTKLQIKEQIRMKTRDGSEEKCKVYYNDETCLLSSIKENGNSSSTSASATSNITDIRMNEGVSKKWLDENTGYIEQTCDEWLITKGYKQMDTNEELSDITYDSNINTNTHKNDMKNGKFGEKKVKIKKDYELNRVGQIGNFTFEEQETYGSIECKDLGLRGCTEVVLDKGCTIRCETLTI